jgi:hypothetical protein
VAEADPNSIHDFAGYNAWFMERLMILLDDTIGVATQEHVFTFSRHVGYRTIAGRTSAGGGLATIRRTELRRPGTEAGGGDQFRRERDESFQTAHGPERI